MNRYAQLVSLNNPFSLECLFLFMENFYSSLQWVRIVKNFPKYFQGLKCLGKEETIKNNEKAGIELGMI